MNIIIIGDIVGRTGRRAVRNFLPQIQEKYSPDIIIANGENAAGGFGLTQRVADELFSYGIDCITMGNHTWDNKDVFNCINDSRIIRPLNFSPRVPGRGWTIINVYDKKVAVINLIGQIFLMGNNSPFMVFDEYINLIQEETDYIIVDFHGEATGEKIAFANYVDGKVTSVVGTHTHVQTADEIILPAGTGYITDLGLTGAVDSVLGMDKDNVIERFLTQIPKRYKVAKGKCKLEGIYIEINESTAKTDNIIRIQVKENNF